MDLREAMRLRRTWLFETQLRRLNTGTFRGVAAGSGDPRLDLISEDAPQPPQLGSRPAGPPTRVYLDSGKPVWTQDEMARRGKFESGFLGRVGSWLDHTDPVRLKARLAELKADYEKSTFGSEIDLPEAVSRFPRTDVPASGTHGGVGDAISRAELAAEKPWLIPELYRSHHDTPDGNEKWLRDLERFIADFETERRLAVDGVTGTLPYDPANPGVYRANIELLLGAEPHRAPDEWIEARLIDRYWKKSTEHGGTHVAAYRYQPALRTPHHHMNPVTKFADSRALKHWMGVFHNPLREVVALKPDSDMGLCHLVRLLYQYGTLPGSVGADTDLTWRVRHAPDERFDAFFKRKAEALAGNEEQAKRLAVAQAKLRVILETSAAHPRSAAPAFSPLAGEILKQGLLAYKFWLDEHPRALHERDLQQARTDLGYGGDADKEMEFWSENHYIMFASSEYLLGQLWPREEFKPAKYFRVGQRETMTGERRRERGRARVLKWLHNRLQFGWTEFNSSGYYREHLWALLNLADFALDEEVRTKAAIAADLLLFDVVRHLHKGAMGAAGGRSQLKSKNSGWDNGVADVVELMFGAQGLYNDGDAHIATIFAASSYVVPDVLLEIGASPPQIGMIDRSRVSITFDEAAKYGIATSLKSDTRDSLLRGYKSKRERHYPFLAQVNAEIARTHRDYGATEDDTVFFWSMSAYFNKQIVRNSLATVDRFGLEKADVFAPSLRLLIEVILPFVDRAEDSLIGGVIGALGGVPGMLAGAVAGFFASDVLAEDLEADAADKLSVFTEGSTRTRANILTYHHPDVMLSSIQNFRPGQLNFQSNVCQATLNTSVNVFTTSGFAGIDVSHLYPLVGGALAGALVGMPVVGAAVAVYGYEMGLKDTNPLGNDTDGPSWWTGYWSLPMIAQAGSAAVIVQDFHDIQEELAEAGTHAWFPKSGFDTVVERRTSAYDDADFPLLDITDIGPKGFWLFGRIVHPAPEGSGEEPREGYVGVFSNQRPEWLDKEFDLHELRLEQARENTPEADRDRLWDAPHPDYFADRDWYVDGKNIWIIQVGSKAEFGGFEEFVRRVSAARIHVDDTGDMECTYDIPKPGGGSDRLSVAYGDGGRFGLNGGPYETDLFPRFGSPFVRGGRVEWGQREYCLEWNSKTLLHDFANFAKPVRQEAPTAGEHDAETVKGLVIYFRTGDEDMDAFTVTTATVDIGCDRVTADQVVAAGPAGEGAQHDAEWIFFDRPARRSTDMSLTLRHTGTEDDTPEWKASFTVKALMGDRTLKDCALSFGAVHFEDERRDSGPLPFAVSLSAWAPWQPLPDGKRAAQWTVARPRPYATGWQPHSDLIVLDTARRLWHQRLTCGATHGTWEPVDGRGAAPDFSRPVSLVSASDSGGGVAVFTLQSGRLAMRWRHAGGTWATPWTAIEPRTEAGPVALDGRSALTVLPSAHPFGGFDVYVTAADGQIHGHEGWRPGSPDPWRSYRVSGFTPAAGVPVQVAGDRLFALTADGTIRSRPLSAITFALFEQWRVVSMPGWRAAGFAVAGTESVSQLAACGLAGDVWLAELAGSGTATWTPVAGPPMSAGLHWVTPSPGRWWLIGTGVDGVVRGLQRADGDSSPAVWGDIGKPGTGTPMKPGLSVTCRAAGQLEVFAETRDGVLTHTWWS